jgi:hypothetical protein
VEREINHVIIAPRGRGVFGLGAHHLFRFDGRGAAHTELKPDNTEYKPGWGWLNGITYDSTRNRLVICKRHVYYGWYAYDVASGEFSRVCCHRPHSGPAGLAYAEDEDKFYALQPADPNDESFCYSGLAVFDPNGIQEEVRPLSQAIPGKDVLSDIVQLTAIADWLVVVRTERGHPDEAFPNTHCYVLDRKSGAIVYSSVMRPLATAPRSSASPSAPNSSRARSSSSAES